MRKPLQTPFTLQTLEGRDMSSYHTSSQECSLIASFLRCMTGHCSPVWTFQPPYTKLRYGGKFVCSTKKKMEISFMNPLLISPRWPGMATFQDLHKKKGYFISVWKWPVGFLTLQKKPNRWVNLNSSSEFNANIVYESSHRYVLCL